jgi:methionine synthase II (cobalamin-independent)
MGRRPATRYQHLHNLIPLLDALDGHVDRAHIECSYDGQWVERELLAHVPESMEVIAGIADVKAKPQNVLELQEKATALLRLIPSERLLLSSSCGCGRVPHDDAIAMTINLVKAARAV